MWEDGDKERWRGRVREGEREQRYKVVPEKMWEDGEKEIWRVRVREGESEQR